jgi:hypothetical protein
VPSHVTPTGRPQPAPPREPLRRTDDSGHQGVEPGITLGVVPSAHAARDHAAMRWAIVLAACGALAACGETGPERVSRAPSLHFVKPPLVFADDGNGVYVWVRLNRPLRDNEGALGERPGFQAGIEIPDTTPDIPGLYRDDLHPTCYGQFLDGTLAAGEQVRVALVLGPDERIAATVSAQRSDPDASALRQLGCPSDRGATRRCRGSVEAPRVGAIDVRSATNASCRTARAVMRRVARWADAGRCYRSLCAPRHRRNRGFRCDAELVGEAAWQITCTRGGRIVRGFTAD